MRPVSVAAAVVVLVGCGDFKSSRGVGAGDDAGGAGGDLPSTSCTSTTFRGFEPLGAASDTSYSSALAWAGDAMGVVWEQAGAAGVVGKLQFAKIAKLGNVVSPRALGAGDDPALLRVDDRLVLFYRRGDAIEKVGLADDGTTVGDPVSVYSPTKGGGTSVAWLGDGYAVAIDGAGALPYEVHLLFTDAGGTALGPPARVAQAGDNSVMPSIAWSGAELGVAWTDMRSGAPGVYFARFSKDGSRLADDLLLSDGAVRATFPTLSAQGAGGWIACYQQKVAPNNQDVFCTRLDVGGNVTQTARLTNAVGNTTNPQALAHGRYTWVIWDDDASGTTLIAWQFLDATGTPILDRPNTSDVSAWRAHGAVTNDALYFADYHTDDGATWIAEGATLNCF